MHLAVSDLVRLVKTVVEVNGVPEEAINIVKIASGVETCTVGFVPRVMAKMERTQLQVAKFAQVVELYKDSLNTHKRRMSHQNCGMALL